MDDEFTDVFRLVLSCNEYAPARVRHELDTIEAIAPVREEAKLVASELVSNAVRHSECAPSDELDVRGRLSAELFELIVHDPGLSNDSPKVQPAPEIGGLGLAIVERVSHRWGSARPDGQVVWAQLALPGRPARGG